MNERIKELAEQADITLSDRDGWWIAYDEDLERFADLVLKEATLQEISDIGQEIEWDTSDMAYRSGGLSVEQAEKQEKLCKYCGGIGRVVCDCRCMPEQEPVAWVSDVDFVEGQFVEGRARRVWWECNTGVGQPLYTALPKREWVSLTDDEVHEAAIKCVKSGQSVDAAIRAIEAKLKERNNG
jgi:hypothetical protein